jgi:hypothetical protein
MLDAGQRAASALLARTPPILTADPSPVVAAAALVVGLVSAWPRDVHPPLLLQHGGHVELIAWIACLLVGAVAIIWGATRMEWRAQVAGLVLAGTGLVVYGIGFAAATGNDSAAVGTPPIVLGVAAGFRALLLTAVGLTIERRQGEASLEDGQP